jgi:hypothetical protein
MHSRRDGCWHAETSQRIPSFTGRWRRRPRSDSCGEHGTMINLSFGEADLLTMTIAVAGASSRALEPAQSTRT